MTTIGPNERSTYPLERTYYVPDQLASDRVTLNRVVNASGTDHADTTTSLTPIRNTWFWDIRGPCFGSWYYADDGSVR